MRGQTWRTRDGAEVIVTARTRGLVRHLTDQQPLDTPVEEFLAAHTWLACDHAAWCCAEHGHHAAPHRGCILR